jgi:WD40 repeat protein
MKKFLLIIPFLLLALLTVYSQTNELSDTVWTKYTYPESIHSVKFTPDRKYLASGGDDGIPKLWDAETGVLIKEFKGNGWAIWGLDINKTGDLIAVVNSISVVTIWNIQTGEIVKVLDEYPNQTHGLEYNSIAFSNNGKYLAANIIKPYEPAIFIWSVSDWKIVGRMENILNPNHVTFSPDDSILAVSNIVVNKDCISIGLYKVPNLNYIGFLGGTNEYGVYQSAFSPDGKYLAGAIESSPNKVWNTSDWSLYKSLGNVKNSRAVAFSPDSKYVILGGGSFSKLTTDIYDNNTGKLIYSYNNRYLYINSDISNSIDIRKDMNYIAVGGAFGIYMLNAKWNPTSVIQDIIPISETLVYPNPTTGTISIALNPKFCNGKWFLYDLAGNAINQGIINFADVFELNVSDLIPNTYFLNFINGNEKETFKFIKE